MLNNSSLAHILAKHEIHARKRGADNRSAEDSYIGEQVGSVFRLRGNGLASSECVCNPSSLHGILRECERRFIGRKQGSGFTLCGTLLHKLWKHSLFSLKNLAATRPDIREWKITRRYSQSRPMIGLPFKKGVGTL